MLTNKPLQQFLDLVAPSSEERGRKAAYRDEARVQNKCFAEDHKRAAANRLAVSTAAGADRPDKPYSALGPRSQSNRLRVGYLKKAIDEAVGMLGMLGDDGNPASIDAVTVLSTTMEYGIMRRIKDVGQRLNITVAMVPPKFVRGIEQGCHRVLMAQVRSERMEQWTSLKYEAALTEQTF